ncbi:MAG: NADH-quinone oxidoreductase subunit N [Solibacterales bacterium]|nr:NADH-quinone oxidoreductase subunit N [Bryobacterales bacterium]|tara:strand:- start:4883 stop:6361 length:1479 start_codon:yes stop_codon:yes gene_type:complete
MNLSFTETDFFVLKPVILLCIFGLGILLTSFLIRDSRMRWLNALTALIAECFVAFSIFQHHGDLTANNLAERAALGGSIVIDPFSVFFNGLFVVSTMLAIAISVRYLENEREHRGEYYALLLFTQAGMAILAQGMELVTLFIGLELMALGFYVLVGFLRNEKRSNEAAIKYLVLGSFSSGLLAYGFSILYGMSGSTSLRHIAAAVAERPMDDSMLLLALITTSVGLLFKISAVPFHMWAPDAYEGAPTPVTAHVSVASKAASFALLLRIFLVPFFDAQELWIPLLGAVGLLTMTLGNVAAVTQTNLKRLFAYSSIAHAGYILLGLVALNKNGLQGISLYLLAYVVMNFGAFSLITAMRRGQGAVEEIDDLSGLVQRHPGYAVCMLIFLLSLAGIPPLAGFYGKYFIFLALLEAEMYVLAIFAALYVAVAAYYYFRIVKVMFLVEGPVEPTTFALSRGVKLALIVTGILTLGIGIYPEPFVGLASNSILPVLF